MRMYRLGYLNPIFYTLLVATLFMVSCTSSDPEGKYSGEIKDWVYEVFEGNLMAGGKACSVELSLSQNGADMIAELKFIHPTMKPVTRSGTWEIGDGERIIKLNDEKEPSEFYLIKRGVRYAFQSKAGLANDDGSPLLLVRNLGKSRKSSYPIEIDFADDGSALVSVSGMKDERVGEWNRVGDRITVSVRLPKTEEGEKQRDFPEENYKYFMRWVAEKEDTLVLEKMVVMKPFVKEDGSKRQSWMSSLIFSDSPLLVSAP
jgi:hypothetical protein